MDEHELGLWVKVAAVGMTILDKVRGVFGRKPKSKGKAHAPRRRSQVPAPSITIINNFYAAPPQRLRTGDEGDR